jgi:NTP pyrophosphatase (non-canonical NTP hydrolase)
LNDVTSNFLDEYQERALRTVPEDVKLEYLASKLIIEAAEAAQVVIKHVHHGHKLNQTKLVEELGDVLWYLAVLLEQVDVTLAECAYLNIEKLSKRYPNGFSVEDSINRTI